MAIELSDEQRKAIREFSSRVLEVVDPATHERYILVPREQYEQSRAAPADNPMHTERLTAIAARIPPGIRRSQEAYWRDLPELLRLASPRLRWVAYHGDQRIGFGQTETELYQICSRRGLRSDEVYVGRMQASDVPPWESEEIEPSLFETDENEKDSHPAPVS